MFIINAIKKIKNSKRILFTTPSNLNSKIIPCGLKTLFGKKIFSSDFSEVEGFDNYKKPYSCLEKSQNRAAEIYNTKKTFYLVNGSSSGILASMLAVLKENDKVLIARNVHESVFNALVLTGAIPLWFSPDYDENFDISTGVKLSDIKKEYSKNPDIKALIITSPTYEGVCSDINAIGDFCKSKNIIFFVDEAHGALFSFSDKLPERAINSGADICVQSLHKTAPALNGSALLHVAKTSNIDTGKIQRNLNLINSTSPSWIIIASIEGAIEFLNSKKCQKEIDRLLLNIEKLKAENPNFEYFSNENYDKTKLLIAKKGVGGEVLSNFLFKNNIEDELVTQKSVLCLCGIGTNEKKLKKLSKILKKFKAKKQTENSFYKPIAIPEMKYTPKEAYLKNYALVEKSKAIGRAIAENITPYPPCIAMLMAGEVIMDEHLKYLPQKVKVIIDND